MSSLNNENQRRHQILTTFQLAIDSKSWPQVAHGIELLRHFDAIFTEKMRPHYRNKSWNGVETVLKEMRAAGGQETLRLTATEILLTKALLGDKQALAELQKALPAS
jgi:hypothetical protein